MSVIGLSQQIVLPAPSVWLSKVTDFQWVKLSASSIWLSENAFLQQVGLSALSIWSSEVTYFQQIGLSALSIWLSGVADLWMIWLVGLNIWLSGIAFLQQSWSFCWLFDYLELLIFSWLDYMHQVSDFQELLISPNDLTICTNLYVLCIILIRDPSSYRKYNFIHIFLKMVVEI